jgi:hypothetical protein
MVYRGPGAFAVMYDLAPNPPSTIIDRGPGFLAVMYELAPPPPPHPLLHQ